MSKVKQDEGMTTATIEVRNVDLDAQTEGLTEIWMAKQKAKGNRLKKGEAAVELIKRGLQAEGITTDLL